MGLTLDYATYVLKEAIRRPFSGSVATLGRQEVYFTKEDLLARCDEIGFKINKIDDSSLSFRPELANKGYISDKTFFEVLGFNSLVSIDNSEFESCSKILDLNTAQLPEEFRNKFTAILNPGTLEHVFHVPNALNNIFEMLEVGGRVFHFLPSHNFVDHGFYMFSPTLALDYYTANNFLINDIQFLQFTKNHHNESAFTMDYRAGCLDSKAYGGLDSNLYGVSCIVTKTKKSTGNVIPQQGFYATNKWKKKVE
jgi:hypothetical protein